MTTTTRMELVPIDGLIPYVNNARTHSKEQIQKLRSSLREFGFVNPVIIDHEKNIIAGHGRIMAAKEEGLKEVPCVYVEHLTEAQKRHTSSPTTAWLWMQAGMKRCSRWNSKLSRNRPTTFR